jgi:hypothetical protein
MGDLAEAGRAETPARPPRHDVRGVLMEERQPAPEFTQGLDWINSDGPLTLRELGGRVVLLDFWTYG